MEKEKKDKDIMMDLQKKVMESDDYCKIVHYNYIEDNFRHLAGKILTIIDASISENRQNKCIKDLIKSEFSEKIYVITKKWYVLGISSRAYWELVFGRACYQWQVTSSGLAKYRLAQMFNYSTKAYWRYFAKPLL